MADITLDELVVKLNVFTSKASEKCKDILVEETPVGPTGGLRRSIKILEQDAEHALIGSQLDYAHYVEYGRGKVVAKNEPARTGNPNRRHTLHYFGYNPGPHSIHGRNYGGGDANVEYFRHSTGPAEPNKFLERAVEDIKKTDFSYLLKS